MMSNWDRFYNWLIGIDSRNISEIFDQRIGGEYIEKFEKRHNYITMGFRETYMMVAKPEFQYNKHLFEGVWMDDNNRIGTVGYQGKSK
jgi:hypothetical protein